MFSIFKSSFKEKRKLVKKRKRNRFEDIYPQIDEFIHQKSFLKLRKGLGIASENKPPRKMYDWVIKTETKSFKIKYTYMIRGSMVEIKHKETGKMLDYIDQQRQYSGILTWNDISNDLNTKQLDRLRLELI